MKKNTFAVENAREIARYSTSEYKEGKSCSFYRGAQMKKEKTKVEVPLPEKQASGRRFPIWQLLTILAFLWLWQELFTHLTVRPIPYSEFVAAVTRGEVKDVAIGESEIFGTLQPKPEATPAATKETPGSPAAGHSPATEHSPAAEQSPATEHPLAAVKEAKSPPAVLFRTDRVEDPDLVKRLVAAGVKFNGVRPSFLTQFLTAWVLPLGLLALLWIFLSRRLGAANPLLAIGKTKARLTIDKDTGVTFADVAGCDEAKEELQEVVDFLKRPERYEDLGAKIPKGVLLVGPPGTGKTLLARAAAGEAGVPFFSLSGSDFVEMFVGVGAARVRDLFQQAKLRAPCIIFIDELDAIGRQRGVRLGTANDEREQTLNQLLVEMDGFEVNKGVILLAATNRPEVLDRALLRPGRFDRQIVVDSPDIDGREAILRVHAKGKPLNADVDFRRLAAATAGFSGADLANVLNEAALFAARQRSSSITQADLEEAVEKVVAGPERKSRRMSEDEKRRVAYHEVGHALVAAFSEHADPVHKISIVPRGRSALGYTMQVPAEEQFLQTKSELKERLRGLLGGRAAEELIFAEASTGAQNDLERATAIARQMVAMFGMSDRLGLGNCAQRPGMFLGNEGDHLQRDCSEQTAREIDEEVKAILNSAYEEAKALLATHRDLLEKITAELLKRESLDSKTFYEMVGIPRPEAPEPGAVALAATIRRN
jgi:cell division protease FtsH